MVSRLKLQDLLEETIGNTNVYSNPPSSMNYPAIKFKRTKIDIKYACNANYILKQRYLLTLITLTSSDDLITKLLELPYCTYDSEYKSDGLYHTIFTLYF